MKQLSVLIPAYKSKISPLENKSLESFFIKLKQFDFNIITFEELDISEYKEVASKFNINLNIIFFHKSFFESLITYTKLLTSKIFYKKFVNYEFVLIAQTDAYVFNDDVISWMSKNFSYIGAPWLDVNGDTYVFRGVGNGGLSLRKVSDHLKVLRRYNSISRIKINFSSHFKQKITLKFFLLVVFDRLYKNEFKGLYFLFTNYKGYEDTFWGLEIPKYFSFFKVAPEMEALGFSFELYPQLCYQLNNYRLPFGCHAPEKYDFEFWKKFII